MGIIVNVVKSRDFQQPLSEPIKLGKPSKICALLKELNVEGINTIDSSCENILICIIIYNMTNTPATLVKNPSFHFLKEANNPLVLSCLSQAISAYTHSSSPLSTTNRTLCKRG